MSRIVARYLIIILVTCVFTGRTTTYILNMRIGRARRNIMGIYGITRCMLSSVPATVTALMFATVPPMRGDCR